MCTNVHIKRIVNCLREGLIPGINLPLLRDALHDPATGLTYEALTGKNKQSVPDCERLVSSGVVLFFERRGSARSAKILKTIYNWHKAVDGRGLDERTRCQYLKDMKAWILDDWMPWHKENPDYSTIDVNRYMHILFSRTLSFTLCFTYLNTQIITTEEGMDKITGRLGWC
jgi:hypothetical protein